MKRKTIIFKKALLTISTLIYFYLIFIGRNQYIFDMTYLKCILFMLMISALIFIYGIFANEDKTYKNNIYIYIVLYIILLISVTFFIGRPKLEFYSWWYAGQYKPFQTIISELNYGSSSSFIKNIIGNSIMIIPFSFLLMIKNEKYNNIIKQTLITLPTILTIEVLQAFTHTGAFDIDDILLNYLGTVLFTFIITRFSIIKRIKKLFYTDFKINDKIKYFLIYFVSFLSIIYIALLFFKIF